LQHLINQYLPHGRLYAKQYVVWKDIEASIVRAKLTETFGAIEKAGSSESGVEFKTGANTAAGMHLFC